MVSGTKAFTIRHISFPRETRQPSTASLCHVIIQIFRVGSRADGSSIEADTIIWATGYNISFPFLDHKLLEWEQGVPKRLAVATLAPGIANLYLNGLVTPRGGNQPIHSATGKLIASCVHAQWSLDHPIADEFAESWAPEARMDYSVPGLIRGVKRSMHVSEGIVRRHDPTDS